MRRILVLTGAMCSLVVIAGALALAASGGGSGTTELRSVPRLRHPDRRHLRKHVGNTQQRHHPLQRISGQPRWHGHGRADGRWGAHYDRGEEPRRLQRRA